MAAEVQKNVLGTPLKPCGMDPITGWYRSGYCEACDEDMGEHTICVVVDEDFLQYSKDVGNDLSTPMPPYFEGLKPGHRWCICAPRWVQAYNDGFAPNVILEATHENMLDHIDLDTLKEYAL
jgi:hypothetical protein